MFKKLLSAFALFALMFAMAAQAAPKPSEVEAEIKAGHWVNAEKMLVEVLKEKPDSAKGWYWMAQVKERLSKDSEARDALLKAEKLDPALKFAKNEQAVREMEKRLGVRGLREAPSAQAAQARPDSAPPQVQAAREPAKPTDWGFVGKILIGLMLIGAAGAAVFWFVNKKTAQGALEEKEKARRRILGRALELAEKAKAETLTAKFEEQVDSDFGQKARQAEKDVQEAIVRLSKQATDKFAPGYEESLMDQLEGQINGLHERAEAKEFGAPSGKASGQKHEEEGAGASGRRTAGADLRHDDPARSNMNSESFGRSSGYAPAGGYAPSAPAPVSGGVDPLSVLIMSEAMRPRPEEHHHHYDQSSPRETRREEPREAPLAFDEGSGGSESWSSSGSEAQSQSAEDSSPKKEKDEF